MNTTLSLTNEHSHPPIALSPRGLLDRSALHFGIGLVRWARRSELLRSKRLAHQRERAARHDVFDRMHAELADQRARADANLLLRSLR